MDNTVADDSFSDLIAKEVPFLRRYARALTGTQQSGDKYTVATLDAIISDRGAFRSEDPIRVTLFKCFHAIWATTGRQFELSEDGPATEAHVHLSKLTPGSREAMLLSSIEDLSTEHIAKILDRSSQEVDGLIEEAFAGLKESYMGKIMIIEDEPIIAADLQSVCEQLGHTVTGIARTRAEAVKLGESDAPDLILADIQLADNSSGIDAVNDLLKSIEIPIIFITAFPERLLTGERPEPAFLISKPFKRRQVQSAVSQAMFFRSTKTLMA